MSGERLRRTQAEVRRSSWPGWIWSVPIAAFGVALWLGIRGLVHSGETVTVTFDNAYGMKPSDTKVMLLGLKVGEVSDIALAADGKHIEATLEIDSAEKKYLRSGTRFFLRGAQLDFSDPSSLKALVSGPEIVMEPGPGKPVDHFHGVDRKPALAPEHGPMVTYAVRFDGAAGSLKDGAGVDLRGFHVGTVTSVRLSYDASTGTLSTPVEIALDPASLGIDASPPNGDWRPLVDGMLKRLIAQGLRARLAQDPPLVGPGKVSLDFIADAPNATLGNENGVAVIPSMPSSNIDAMTSKADQILQKIDDLPIRDIGEQVRSMAARINTLTASASPKIKDSLTHIDHSVAQIDRTLQKVSPQIGPLVAQLRQTANEADQAVAAANHTLGGDATSQNGLPEALRELTDTARSIRALADYLDRHPEALIRGKQKEKP
ncbi:MAG TPA: MlaD family protein [Dyella sp.]|uniref:MlaD family protein n=1 Tax=Dyella sp. TaxID=1869338 RepID=UPI002C2B3414|nr:MlaD family protein [Dyella sp.]HUB91097.1 MlaD family protein [Dyella sp.]